MDDLKRIYLQGKMTTIKMNNEGWLEEWKGTAADAEAENCQLVVFKIPNDQYGKADSEVTSLVERTLQEKLGPKN